MSFDAYQRWLETEYRSRSAQAPLSRSSASDYVSRLRTLARISGDTVDGAPVGDLHALLNRLANDAELGARLGANNPKAVSDTAVTLRTYLRFLDGRLESRRAPDSDRVAELLEELQSQGFVLGPGTQRLYALQRGTAVIYVKRKSNTMPIVVHPDFESLYSRLASLPGIHVRTPFAYYHDSGMRRFPKRLNDGATPTPYGVEFDAKPGRARALASAIAELAADVWDERAITFDQGPDGVSDEGPGDATEREQIAKARIGQGRFRSDLVTLWQACPITAITRLDLLRASHIKPWKKSTNRERLDPNNGLLLAVHLDLLFDKGLISFDDDGRMLIAQALSQAERSVFGLSTDRPRIRLRAGNLPYLAHHRANVFLDAPPT